MNTFIRAATAGLILAGLGGCAGGGTPSGTGPGSGNRDIISMAEIQESQAATALDIIQELRPRWLMRNRGLRTIEGTLDAPYVVMDDLPPRRLEYLGEIPRDVLVELRWIPPREATFLYGTGFTEGVIKVTTRH